MTDLQPQTYIVVITPREDKTMNKACFLTTPDCSECDGTGFLYVGNGVEDCMCRQVVLTNGYPQEITDDDLHRLISHLHTAHVCSPPCARNVLVNPDLHFTTEVIND